MEGPKSASELKPVVEFLNRNLRSQYPWSIVDEYPTVFTDSNLRNIQIIEDNGSVLSHAALHPMIIRTPYSIFKVAAVGSVVTDPSYRKKGLSRKLIENCLALATEQNCDFAILWTDLYDFYRKIGFELSGQEVSIIWDKDYEVKTDGPRRYSDQNNVASTTLLGTYGKHTVCSIRTVNDVHQYLKIPNTEVFTSWSPDHQLMAYAISGKGADLQNYIHEWGGRVNDLMALFDWIHSTRQQPMTIISPAHSTNFISECKKLNVPINHGFLGMIKILNQPQFLSKIERRAKTLGLSDFRIRSQEEKFIVSAHGEEIEIANENVLTQLIFGPPHATALLGKNLLTEKLDRIFPIEMWVWGWDSI